jgi:hypothetical protein
MKINSEIWDKIQKIKCPHCKTRFTFILSPHIAEREEKEAKCPK